jgi:hypothetical protein
MRTRTKSRYILPTGKSLLTNQCLEMMHAHLNSQAYKYDDKPFYRIAEAVSDQNTLVIVFATEDGHYGEADKLQ